MSCLRPNDPLCALVAEVLPSLSDDMLLDLLDAHVMALLHGPGFIQHTPDDGFRKALPPASEETLMLLLADGVRRWQRGKTPRKKPVYHAR